MEAILQAVEVDTIQAGEFRKPILRDAFLDSNCPDSLANESIDVVLLQCSRLVG